VFKNYVEILIYSLSTVSKR